MNVSAPVVEFAPFPKLARLNREFVITEKIDGTNAQVFIPDLGDGECGQVLAGSRKRWITPGDDNFGFAAWVYENAGALAATLGPGRHFGEWWGSGIQRGYGFTDGNRCFSLFNTLRWTELDLIEVPQLSVVPVIAHVRPDEGIGWRESPAITHYVAAALEDLELHGSQAAPGFMRPEGIVLWHVAANRGFKVTIDNDGTPKSRVA